MIKYSKGKRLLALLLSVVTAFTAMQISVSAAKGDLTNVSTGLSGNIDTSDTISLPIKILDYESDGMLFEYAESYAPMDSDDFGATFCTSFTELTSSSTIPNSSIYNFGCVTTSINSSNSNASFMRASWSKNVSSLSSGYHTAFSGITGRAGAIIPNDLGNLAMDDIRYLVLVYRSNVTSSQIAFSVERVNADRSNTANRTGNYTFTSEGATNWTYAVYDLKQGNLKNSWSSYGKAEAIWTSLPLDSSGDYMDIAYVALFADSKQAEKFGAYAITDGSDRGDNRGFGLLRGSREEYPNDTESDNYPGLIDETDTVYQFNTFSSSVSSLDYSTIDNLGYNLLGTFKDNGIANIGLLESSLSDRGLPVYKQEVVTYVANLLKHSLEIPERTSDGWKNYRYVKGTASDIYGGTDLATALRTKIGGNMGTYAQSAAKDLVGTWGQVSGNIASYYDAAYFLLNSIFVDGSYNEPQDDYNYLVLSAGIDSQTGNEVYIFDASFTDSATPASANMAINYDTTNKTIQNTSAAGKTHFYYDSSSGTTSMNPFLPITDKNNSEGQTQTVYYQDDGVLSTGTTQATYVNRNFNFAMYSSGEFVYHADDELFFDFEGDDDVYLFINGELVMDIGSAHSVDGVRFELNDYVNWAKANPGTERATKLALEEGNTYSFSFYYMERHGYGSNMRIENNFRITDPSMSTGKTAYQNDIQLDYDSIVNKDKVIEYGFSLTNNGEENLYNLTFRDADIGVNLTYNNGLEITGSRVYDVNGGTLDASDLVATVSHPDYADVEVTFKNNDALKSFLTDLTNSAVLDSGGGLWSCSTVAIRGIGYMMSEEQIDDGLFINTVLTSSTNLTMSKTLYGQASMRVFIPSNPMYYQWAGHELKVTRTKFIEDTLAAASDPDSILADKVDNLNVNNVNIIEFTTSKGNAITYDYVSMDSDYDFTINYPKAGSNVFYVRITYNNSKNTVLVPVLVNITDVKDSVFVLDYGLGVELTDGGELFKNDNVTVPGRTTLTKLWGISTETPSYSPNNITFSAAGVNTVDGNYGDYSVSDDSLRYVPDEFLEGTDSVYLAVGVYEDGESNNELGNVNINKEVQMYKSVTVLPANVVYYEDSFPAIKYNTATANTITTVRPADEPLQNADQNEQYGHDDVYENTDVDEYSAGSLTTITINEYTKVASFTFKGTGFELIGRTNARDSATMVVKVKDADGKTLKTIPVITEYDNNGDGGDDEIYQVPVIRVKDLSLTAQTYTVEISGVPARDYNNRDENGVPAIIPTYLYIDGLHIYQPVEGVTENDKVLENEYLATEQNAQFVELRDQIVQGNIAVVDYDINDGITVSTGTSTWTENLIPETSSTLLKFNEVNSIEDYLRQGPNNEVYITGTYDDSALVFYVKELDEDIHSLQIAVRGINESLFFAGVESDAVSQVDATVRVGVYEDSAYKWDDMLVNSTASTVQHYVIDYTKCYYDTTKDAYQVVVRVDNGMVSFAGLKLTGLELLSIEGEKTDLMYENGVLMQNAEMAAAAVAMFSLEADPWVEADASAYVNFYSVRRQMDSTVLTSEETEEEEEETVEEETTTETETEASDAESTDSSTRFDRWLAKIYDLIKKLAELFRLILGFDNI